MMSSDKSDYVIYDVTNTDSQQEKNMLETILSVSYDLCLTSYRSLGGYGDVSYHVTVADNERVGLRAKLVSDKNYVLRIFNAQDSTNLQWMEATNDLLDHVIRKGVFTQSTVMNRQNKSVSVWRFGSQGKEEVRVVCLRAFLPGESLSDVTLALYYKLGVFVADLTRIMENFQHPFFETFDFTWSVDNNQHRKDLLHFVKDQKWRQILEEIVEHLPNELFGDTTGLKTGQIHGDISLNNIIFQNPGDWSNDFSQWGLIDFHDTHKTFCLYELSLTAVSLAPYAAKEKLSISDAISHLVTGYRSLIPLGRKDLEFVISGMKARLCNLILNGHRKAQLDPENKENIINSLNPAWNMLIEIYRRTKQEFIDTFMTEDIEKNQWSQIPQLN